MERGKRWATPVNEVQIAWLKGIIEEAKKGGADENFTGSVIIQELIEEARASDRPKLVRRLVQRYLQRKVERLQEQLDALTTQQAKPRSDGEKTAMSRKKELAGEEVQG